MDAVSDEELKRDLLARKGYGNLNIHTSQHYAPIPGWLPPVLSADRPV